MIAYTRFSLLCSPFCCKISDLCWKIFGQCSFLVMLLVTLKMSIYYAVCYASIIMDISLGGVPHKSLGILPAFFHRWSTTRLLREKKNPYTVLLYYSTVPLLYEYFKLLLHCSAPGTDSCTTTTVLYCCTTAVLFCTVLYYCTELYWCTAVLLQYCRVTGAVLLLYLLLRSTILFCTVLMHRTQLHFSSVTVLYCTVLLLYYCTTLYRTVQ